MKTNFESLGEHLRNAYQPYCCILSIIKEMKKAEIDGDTTTFNQCKNFIYSMEENIQHLIDISKMPEVEKINWRKTDLAKNYYKEIK